VIAAHEKRSGEMKDAEVMGRIEQLVEEEHGLLSRGSQEQGLDAEGHARLDEVKVQLDRCWDLLRQRRAREEFGLDADAVSARPAEVVENYEQ
jgi:hypothetical protein